MPATWTFRPRDDRARVAEDGLHRRVPRDEAALHAASIARRGRPSPDRVVGRASTRRPGSCDRRRGRRRARRRRAPSSAGRSVTKLLTAYATLVAAEEGAVDLDEPAGPEGSTVRHLLAHACGLRVRDAAQPIAEPGERRIYSNTGFDRARRARRGARRRSRSRRISARPSSRRSASRRDARGRRRPAAWSGTFGDMLRFGRELLAPTLIAPETLAEATTVQFPGLDGVLPGFGRSEPERLGARLRASRRASRRTGRAR